MAIPERRSKATDSEEFLVVLRSKNMNVVTEGKGRRQVAGCDGSAVAPGATESAGRFARSFFSFPAAAAMSAWTLALVAGWGVMGVDAARAQDTAEVRKLGVGDAIQVVVFREPELTGEYKVNEQGTVNYPLLGRLVVSGKTEEILAAEIEAALEKDYVRDAQVSVDVIGKGAIQISVLGEVRSPGRLSFGAEEKVDLGTVLLVAGGPSENANLTAIEVKRRDGDDLSSLKLSMPADRGFALRKDDSVIVAPLLAAGAKRAILTVLGQVARPGAMEIPPGRDLDLLTAIALAGGMTPTARTSKVIVRREGSEPMTVNVARVQKGEIESPLLQGGDTVFIPESIF